MQKVNITGLDTARLPKLTAKESSQLMDKIKEGDERAREYFLMANARLVLSVMKRFNIKNQDPDDIFQVGYLGMVKAINNFNFDLGVRFSTYAVPMIIGEIRRFLRDSTSVKVTRSMRDTAYKALKKKEEICYLTGVEPSLTEVGEELDISVSEIACALDAVSDVVSYYTPVANDGDGELMLFEQISDPKENDARWGDYIALNACIENLPDKEKEIIDLRYYKGMTQKEIASAINISQAQVSRLENMAIAKMKEVMI